MKNFKTIFLYLFSFVSFKPLFSQVEKAGENPSQKPAVKVIKLSEDDFAALMDKWEIKLKEIKEKNEAPEVFVLAAQIVKANPDFLLELAEGLAVLLKEEPTRGKALRLQWDKLSKAQKLILISSAGENMWEMLERLRTKGNG